MLVKSNFGAAMKFRQSVVCLILLFIPYLGFAEVTVKNPWIAAPPPGSRALAAYMQIHNKGERDRLLSSVTSVQFEDIQIHRSGMKSGMMTMEQVSSLVIPAQGRVELSSRGLHMMLMSPVRYLKDGDTIGLDLVFEDGAVLKISVPVKKR